MKRLNILGGEPERRRTLSGCRSPSCPPCCCSSRGHSSSGAALRCRTVCGLGGADRPGVHRAGCRCRCHRAAPPRILGTSSPRSPAGSTQTRTQLRTRTGTCRRRRWPLCQVVRRTLRSPSSLVAAEGCKNRNYRCDVTEEEEEEKQQWRRTERGGRRGQTDRQFWMQGSRPVVEVVRLGLVSYQEALRLQQVYVNRHRAGPAHALLLCEHLPVYTTGIRHKPYPAAMLDRLRLLGADVQRTNRGGLITFHGPGQLVCYPVLNLSSFKKSVRWYVCELERTIISACRRFGIEASTSPHTGVWVGDNKICAIGIHCGRYVTSHGLALNCNTDMSWFGHIVPCGIEGKGVTSLSAELQRDVSVEETIPHLLDAFRDQFNCQLTDGQTPETDQDPAEHHQHRD